MQALPLVHARIEALLNEEFCGRAKKERLWHGLECCLWRQLAPINAINAYLKSSIFCVSAQLPLGMASPQRSFAYKRSCGLPTSIHAARIG